jgi:hypothetical protein
MPIGGNSSFQRMRCLLGCHSPMTEVPARARCDIPPVAAAGFVKWNISHKPRSRNSDPGMTHCRRLHGQASHPSGSGPRSKGDLKGQRRENAMANSAPATAGNGKRLSAAAMPALRQRHVTGAIRKRVRGRNAGGAYIQVRCLWCAGRAAGLSLCRRCAQPLQGLLTSDSCAVNSRLLSASQVHLHQRAAGR